MIDAPSLFSSLGLTTPEGLARVAFESMGTTVECLLPADRVDAAATIRELFADWQTRLTRFDPDSELSRVNARAGHETEVSPFLFDVLGRAIAAAAATGGLFDPTLLRRLELLGYDRTFALVARDGDELPQTLSPHPIGGWRSVRLDPTRLTVTLPRGAAVDLGGIAKGMAVDAAIALLGSEQVAPVAVDAGGDLAVTGTPENGGWSIAVELPAGSRVVTLFEGALATSAVGRRAWRRGQRQLHHLLDPRTGLPAENEVWSVSVAARRCEQAEVAAKAALLLGLDGGARFLEANGMPGLFVLRDGRQVEAGPWRASGATAASATTPGAAVRPEPPR